LLACTIDNDKLRVLFFKYVLVSVGQWKLNKCAIFYHCLTKAGVRKNSGFLFGEAETRSGEVGREKGLANGPITGY
jgi:hypothetical protein